MEVQKCKICGHRHHRYEPHQLAPEAPRSNAQPPNPGIQDKVPANVQARSSHLAPDESEPRERIPRPSKPDTEPSTPLLVTLVTELTDAQLRPYYNEWMRRKMKRVRAKP